MFDGEGNYSNKYHMNTIGYKNLPTCEFSSFNGDTETLVADLLSVK